MMIRRFILLLVSMLVLVGCTSQTKVVVIPDSKVLLSNQDVTAWTLTEWKTPQGEQAFIPEQRKGEMPITLRFHALAAGQSANEGKVTGFTGCHYVQGTYVETSHTLVVSTLTSTATSTKRFCKPAIEKMETAFAQRLMNTALQKTVQATNKGNVLVLTSKYGDQWTFAEAQD